MWISFPDCLEFRKIYIVHSYGFVSKYFHIANKQKSYKRKSFCCTVFFLKKKSIDQVTNLVWPNNGFYIILNLFWTKIVIFVGWVSDMKYLPTATCLCAIGKYFGSHCSQSAGDGFVAHAQIISCTYQWVDLYTLPLTHLPWSICPSSPRHARISFWFIRHAQPWPQKANWGWHCIEIWGNVWEHLVGCVCDWVTKVDTITTVYTCSTLKYECVRCWCCGYDFFLA